MEKTSNGLMGLPHFRTSRVSMEMYEPVYLNLFTVDFQLPTKLSRSVSDKNLLLEGVKKVNGLDTNKIPSTTEQHYKYSKRSFSGSGVDGGNTSIDVSLAFEVNLRGSANGSPDMYTMKMLREWNDLIYDPLTGRQGLKVDYVAPMVTITMHDKANQPFWQWILYNVFPITSIPGPSLEYLQTNSLWSIENYTLRCDYWDETMI